MISFIKKVKQSSSFKNQSLRFLEVGIIIFLFVMILFGTMFFSYDLINIEDYKSKFYKTVIFENDKSYNKFDSCSFLSVTADQDNDKTDTKLVYSESSDGFSKFLGTSDVHSWDDVRNNSTGNQAFDDTDNYLKGILAAYNSKLGDMYVISRSYFSFDTSFLSSNAQIINVSLNLFGCGTNESNVCMVAWTDGEDGVDLDDYGKIGSVNFGNTHSWNIDRYNRIYFNEKGINYVNKTGYTHICCREYDHDFLNNKPTADRLAEYRNGHYFAEEQGTDKDPYLLIEYIDNTSSDKGESSDTSYLSFTELALIILVAISIIAIMKRKK